MANSINKKNKNDVEVLDFDDNPPKKENKKNNKNNTKKESKSKSNKKQNKYVLPILSIIVGIFVVIGGIAITKQMIDEQKNNSTKNETDITENNNTEKNPPEIEIKEELKKLIDIQNIHYLF